MNNSLKNRIFLSPPHMSGKEKKYLLDAFDSNWIAPLGPHVDALEKEFVEFMGEGHAAALSSGTAALHLALRIIGVGLGDEVILPSFTFVATANAVKYMGATPLFLDCSRETWTLDPNLLEEELKLCSSRNKIPKAIITVDLYGQCADYDAISAICSKYEIPIIEDSCESLGSTYKSKKAGTLGEMAVFSFNGNKIITSSGGGVLVSRNKSFVERARFLSTQAREPRPYYEHHEVGYNYRMSNILAAIARGQLQVIGDRVEKRRDNNKYYRRELSQINGLTFMPEAKYGRSNCWLTCVQIDHDKLGVSAEQLRIFLEEFNIESRPVWKPLHLQKAFADCPSVNIGVSESIFRDGLCLPSGSSITKDELMMICDLVKKKLRPADSLRA